MSAAEMHEVGKSYVCSKCLGPVASCFISGDLHYIRDNSLPQGMVSKRKKALCPCYGPSDKVHFTPSLG